MTDFDFDCKEKKRIAAGAYHKKNGSKSKGCSLPHDHENTKKLNGPVKTIDLDRPMKWRELRGMTEDQQRMYIERCMELYGASANMLADMFGITPTTVGERLRALGIKPRSRAYQSSKAQRAMWSTFCNGVVGGQPGEQKPKEPETVEPEPVPAVEEKPEDELAGITFLDDDTILSVNADLVAERDRLRMERDFYKQLYNELLDRLAKTA